MRRRIWSACDSSQHFFSNIVLPGTSGTPPVITRPGSPQACASTAVIMLEKRISLQHAADHPSVHLQARAGDVGGGIGKQEDGGAGELAWLSIAAHGDGSEHALALLVD